MPQFDVAHIREQGQDMLLFPLDDSFDHKPQFQQNALLAELQMRAHQAGLGGRAVAIWERGGRTYTLGPQPWQGFLRSIDMRFVLRNVNQEIRW